MKKRALYHIATASLMGAASLTAQAHDHAAPGAGNEALHMRMTAARPATREDSLKAMNVARELRVALAPYKDTAAATAAGFKMFLPELKEQKVYHFTNNMNALKEAFRFDPAKPTSLLYKKAAGGSFELVGAMYTAPKRFAAEKLDSRVPLSIAQWHQHVNWCLPKSGDRDRWLERRNGQPLFGPESAIASESACKAVGGEFRDSVFGWMLHANVFAGDDLAAIFGDEHAGHDMHAGMKMDGKM